MRKSRKNWIVALASIGAVSILVSAVPVLAVSPPPPLAVESGLDTPQNDPRSAIQSELLERRANITSSSQASAPRSREVDVDSILGGLEARGNLTQGARQQLLQGLARFGYSAQMPDKLRKLQDAKSLVDPNVRKPRIINGANTPITSNPWQVALVRSSSSKNIYQGQTCGGSIIGVRWILTAAHCVDYFTPSQLFVVSGLATLPEGPAPAGRSSSVKSIIIHPMWGNPFYADKNPDASNLYDVALIELSAPLQISSSVRPIDLATSSPAIGQEVFVSGWGIVDDSDNPYPYDLQGGSTPVAECDPQQYGESESILCAGTSVGDRVDACYGDSGGPLTYGGKLVGVVSMGPSCPPAGIGVYANVDYFSSWIMCHAQVANPFGGPHICGDEAGFITVADTLKVAKGTWGGQSVTYKWLADNVAIPRQTKSTLALTGLLGKRISVEIRSAISRTETLTQRYDFAKDDQEIQSPVDTGIRIDLYPSGDFVPCTEIKLGYQDLQWPQKGSCTGTKGQANGQLQSSPGFASGKFRDENGTWRDASYYTNAFWAYRDVNLAPKTSFWTWGVIGAFSRGTNTNDGIGAEYFGAMAPSTWNKNGYPDQTLEWQGWSTFKVSPGFPYKNSSEAFEEYCYSEISGPMGLSPSIWGYYDDFAELVSEHPTGEAGEAYEVEENGVIFFWDIETLSWIEAIPFQEPSWLCQAGFSDQKLNGNKGRVVMGTYGSETLGTRFSFDLGVVVSEHE